MSMDDYQKMQTTEHLELDSKPFCNDYHTMTESDLNTPSNTRPNTPVVSLAPKQPSLTIGETVVISNFAPSGRATPLFAEPREDALIRELASSLLPRDVSCHFHRMVWKNDRWYSCKCLFCYSWIYCKLSENSTWNPIRPKKRPTCRFLPSILSSLGLCVGWLWNGYKKWVAAFYL